MKTMKMLSLALMSVGLCACGTLTTVKNHPCPYNGVRADYQVLTGGCYGLQGCLGEVVVKPLSVIDMPFSAVLDTVLLPVQGVRYAMSDDQDFACLVSGWD